MVSEVEQIYKIMKRDGLAIASCLEQLSWLVFLRVLENLERKYGYKAELKEKRYEPIIEPKYSWSNWAKESTDAYDLKSFIENDLLPHLKSLHGSKERKIVATTFSEVKQQVKNPFYLKRLCLPHKTDLPFHSLFS